MRSTRRYGLFILGLSFLALEGCGGAGPVGIPPGEGDAGARRDARTGVSPGDPRGDAATDPDAGGDASRRHHPPRDAGPDTDDEAEADPPAPADASTCGYSATGTLGAFVFTGEPGDEAHVGASSVMAGITAGSFGRSPGLQALGGEDSINSSGWGLGRAPDDARYYTFSVTPASGCQVTVTSLGIDVRASTDGPLDVDLATSADGFAAHGGAFSGTSAGTVAVGASAAGPLEVRLYGFGAADAEGTLRVEGKLTIEGTLR